MTHTASTPFFALLGQTVARAWRVFINRRQFAELKDWSDEQLKDVGLTRSDVRRALAQPFYTDPTSLVSAAKVQSSWLDVRPANTPLDRTSLAIIGTRRPDQDQLAA
ncbi:MULTISPECIES: DUF1127 domain-containing protein [Stappiaceae]|uniref:DUF1127 domain-containing protein n=1 Tax=Stappiaceae TaxID=2821832 RepID=UPI0012FE334D|nr:DUF1127 domain-containing protein [Labrenzia sp. VG12]